MADRPDVIIVNGRFLRARPTGMHGAARALVHGGRAAGAPLEVWAPPGIDDPLVDRTVAGPAGRRGDHLWEQLVLPAAAGRRVVLSPINTAPVLARRSAVWVHDLGPVVGPHWFRPSMRSYARLLVCGARRAELVLAPSRQVAAELVAIGVPAARVHTLRTPVRPQFRPASQDAVAQIRRRFGLARPYVVHLGSADPRKDALTAAAAHLLVLPGRPHDLVLAGRPHPTFAPVPLPAAPSIRALGYVDDGDLPGLLSGAAALVFPSVYEGFGLPPLEALACGTPALVSDLPALQESTWGQARYLPPGDVARWADGLRSALDGEVEVLPLPAWGEADMGRQLVAALATLGEGR